MSLNLYWDACPNPDKENGFHLGMYAMIVGVNKFDDKGIAKFKERVKMLKLIGYSLANNADGPWFPLDDEWLAGWKDLKVNVEALSDAKWKHKFFKLAADEAAREAA